MPNLSRAVPVAALLAGLAVAQVSQPVQAADPPVLRRGVYAGIASLDPQKAFDIAEIHLHYDLYEGLLTPDAACKASPGLAARWEVTADGLGYTFHLCPDAAWSDGSPVTAHDLVFAWRRLVDPKTAAPFAQYLWPVQNAKALNLGTLTDPAALGAVAVDDRTLRVTLERPAGYFLSLLMGGPLAPLPRAQMEGTGDGGLAAGKAVTNGAYVPTGFIPDTRIELAKNPHFHGRNAVALGSVHWVLIENEDSELRRFRAGELDATWTVPGAQVQWVRQNLPGRLMDHVALGTDFLGINLRNEPWKSQPGLRRALTLALDRDLLAEKVLMTGEPGAVTFVPPGIDGYPLARPDWAEAPLETRLAEARRLLAEAGFPEGRGLEVELLYATGDTRRRLAVAIAALYKQQLGIAVRTVNVEQTLLSQALGGGTYKDLIFGRWLVDYPDPNAFLEAFRSDVPSFNFAGYDDPGFDRMLDAANAIVDPAERLPRMSGLERMVMDAVPLIPVYHRKRLPLVAARVRGWVPNALGCNPSRFLSLAGEG